MQSDHAKVVAAARAAVSWARARRALWTDAPLPIVELPVEPRPIAAVESRPSPAPAAAAAQKETVHAPAMPVSSAAFPADSVAAGGSRSSLRWMAIAAAAVALVGGVAVGYPYLAKIVSSSKAANEPAGSDGAVDPSAARSSAPASLKVTSTPPGAQLFLDGKLRGLTPATLTDVTPGKHTVELKHKAGTVTRTLTVDPGDTRTIDELIFAGWISVTSPTELTVSMGGAALTADERGQIMLPPGVHEIQFANKALGYAHTQRVEVKPGEVTRVTITPPRAQLTVTTSDPAEVFLDGIKIGDAPITDLAIDPGVHEVFVKRPGAERRFTITAGDTPTTINVDFSKP